MNICDYLESGHIFLEVPVSGKEGVFSFLAEEGHRAGLVKNRKKLLEGLQRREAIMSTGVGNGIALPHAAVSDMGKAAILLARLAKPVDFNAMDSLPVDIILALILPQGETHLHLRLLAGLSKLCKSQYFLSAIRLSENPEMLWQALKAIDGESPFP
jgi:mannitol/fructose-specific phosphotransferase system IIA component (Ntr-type)